MVQRLFFPKKKIQRPFLGITMKLYNLLSPLDYSVMFLIRFNILTLPLIPSKLVLLHAVFIFFFIYLIFRGQR